MHPALKATPEWSTIRRYIGKRIEELHRSLETPLGIEDTQTVRGQIAELRLMVEQVDIAAAGPSDDMPDDRPQMPRPLHMY